MIRIFAKLTSSAQSQSCLHLNNNSVQFAKNGGYASIIMIMHFIIGFYYNYGVTLLNLNFPTLNFISPTMLVQNEHKIII